MLNRIEIFKKRLKSEKLDGFLVSHPVNRNYLSHFSGSSGLLILSQAKAYFLTDSRYTTQAKQEVKGAQLVLQTKFQLAEAAALVKKAGIGRLGFEAMHVTVAMHEYLAKELPKVELVATRNWVEQQRAIKDAEEMVRLRQAAKIADRTVTHILPFLKPGVRERDIAAEMEHFMRQEGASGPSFDTIVASGPRAALPHGIASDKKIQSGDFVVMDFGCLFGHYCSDLTRTIGIGKLSAEQKVIYKTVQQAQKRALDWIKEGRTCGQVDEKARGFIQSAGFGKYFGHGLGHGVGMEVHEEPRLGPKVDTVLKAGMAVTVEPGIYLPGKTGVRIEDLVLVTKNGCENLYQSSKDLIIV